MSLLGIAAALDVPTRDLEELFSGHVSLGISARTGVLRGSLQQYIDGNANILTAALIGTPRIDAQELRNRIGREGAIGLVLGYCLAKRK